MAGTIRVRRAAAAAAAAVLLAAATSVSWMWWTGRNEPLPPLVVATGNTGGVYEVYGAGLAAVANNGERAQLTALSTAASVENLRLVADAEVDIGFSLADVAALAVAGRRPYDEALPLAALARIYDNRTHLVVRAESEVTDPDDLAGMRVSVGSRDSGTELIAERVLATSGVDPDTGIDREQMPLLEACDALRAGDIDAFFWSGGLPTGAVSELAADTPIRLVDLSQNVAGLQEQYGDVYSEVSIPSDTYADVENVGTIGVPNLLVVRADMPAAVAEEFTRLLFESRGELIAVHEVALQLNPRAAVATLPVPLHPGAAQYYRSQKTAYSIS